MRRFWIRLRGLWPGWTLLMPLPLILWSGAILVSGSRRWELLFAFLFVSVASVLGPRSRRLLIGVYPLMLVGMLYDLMRFGRNVGLRPDRVLTCDLQLLDARLFGTMDGALPVGPTEWLAAHGTTFLDVYCALPYGGFIFVVVLYAIFLYLRDYARLLAFGWSFFFLNVLGFATYHVLPAAPPWYVHTHGCVADLGARASEGARLAHVDALLGTQYFSNLYGRSSDLFGAIPSLHVAYPLLILMVGWHLHGGFGRSLALLFWLSMCFAAMYLDHHWAVDVVLGLVYTVVVFAVVDRSFPARGPASAASGATVVDTSGVFE